MIRIGSGSVKTMERVGQPLILVNMKAISAVHSFLKHIPRKSLEKQAVGFWIKRKKHMEPKSIV